MEENRSKRKKYLLIFGSLAILAVVILATTVTSSGRVWLTRTWQALRGGNPQGSGSFSELFPPDGTVTTQALTIEGHTYRLKINTDKKQLVPLPGESANFDIQLTEGSRILNALPPTLTEHAKAQSPTLQLKITGVANIYEKDGGYPIASPARLPGAATYIYSPQVTDRCSYPYGKDVLEATLDFSSGSVQVGYVYGGGKIADQIKLQATAIFYDGQIKQGVELPFADEKIIATSNKVPSTQYLKKDIYYQVSFAPTRVDSSKEVNVKLTVKSINSKTGKVDANPYQRVRIEIWPMRAFYAFKEARFEEAGKFLVSSFGAGDNAGGTISYSYDKETGERTWAGLNTDNPILIRDIYWYLIFGDNSFTANTSTTVEKKTLTWLDQQIINYQKEYLTDVYTEKQMADYLASIELLPTHVNYAELDLIDGVGEVYFRYSGNVGAVPYVTFVVSPVDFLKTLRGASFPYCDGTGGFWGGGFLPVGNHRAEPDFCLPPYSHDRSVTALYGEWMTEASFKKLQQETQTMTYLPIDR